LRLPPDHVDIPIKQGLNISLGIFKILPLSGLGYGQVIVNHPMVYLGIDILKPIPVEITPPG
jgi:hypothetical protein